MSKPRNSWIMRKMEGYRRTWAGHCLKFYDGKVHTFHQQEFPHLKYSTIEQHLLNDGYIITGAGFLVPCKGKQQWEWE